MDDLAIPVVVILAFAIGFGGYSFACKSLLDNAVNARPQTKRTDYDFPSPTISPSFDFDVINHGYGMSGPKFSEVGF